MKNILKKIHKISERGQAIILIAFSIIGMVSIVGLMVDGGMLLIEYARLKRGIDAASIAAASQFRKGFVGADLEKAGREFLKFNQSDAVVSIFTCDYPGTAHDATLCFVPARKLVRITASRKVKFGFMRVLGFNETTVSATSVGEAASIDMILAIDTSGSMAYETTGKVLDPNFATRCPTTDCVDPDKSDQASPGHPHGDDPEWCNGAVRVEPTDPGYAAYLARRCEPMGTVTDVAMDFVDELFFPYDRVALVAFTGQATNGTATRNAVQVPDGGSFMDNIDTSVVPNVPNTEIQGYISNLKVFQPFHCPNNPYPGSDLTLPGTCLLYDSATGNYINQYCIPSDSGNGDPSTCGTSNIGAGLYLAGDQFADARQDSFWVVIALFGGPANAATPVGYPDGKCSNSLWDLPGGPGYCRDLDPLSANRHFRNVDLTFPDAYDADDYARDSADYITSKSAGQGATLYSICMGKPCRNYRNTNDPASGEHLGQYMALQSGGAGANHGLYFYSNDAAGLTTIFGSIAENIFTRISQ